MNIGKLYLYASSRLGWLPLLAWLLWPVGAFAATEDTLDVLQVGSKVYTNVTVTTKAKDYIFILHANGMTSIKTSLLSPEVQEKLGYFDEQKAKAAATNTAVAWAQTEVAKLEGEKIKEVKKQMHEKWQANKAAGKAPLASALSMVPMKYLWIALGVGLASYLFSSFCMMLISRKAGHEPGIWVWLPIFQMGVMLRAAKMSLWWMVALLLPFLNLVAYIVWCFKIAQARGKSAVVGILLLLPITSLFAFLYLAFSSGSSPDDDDKREPEIMSLQTA